MSNSDFFGEMRQYERENNIQENYESEFMYGMSKWRWKLHKADMKRIEAQSEADKIEAEKDDERHGAFIFEMKVLAIDNQRTRVEAKLEKTKSIEETEAIERNLLELDMQAQRNYREEMKRRGNAKVLVAPHFSKYVQSRG